MKSILNIAVAIVTMIGGFGCNSISASEANENHTPDNQMLAFSLLQADNGKQLLADHNATISGDTIKILVPYLVDFKLKPTFVTERSAKVYVDGAKQKSGKNTVDFSTPVQYKVVAKGNAHTYTVMVYNSGLPVVFINTNGSKPITSKRTWLDSTTVTIYRANGELDYHTVQPDAQIKGRGNSTWSVKAKRPYALKIKKKAEILGMPKGKRWCLLANFFDPSLFRNDLANYLGQNYTSLDWTPHGQNVELVLNGKHCGNYYLCEQAKTTKGRVPGEYLIEADRKAGRGDITGIKTGNFFNVKDIAIKGKNEDDPEVIAEAKRILDRFETTLYGPDFLNPKTGYKTLIDVESFVDWLLIKELSKDFDGNMFTSCFCHIMPDGIIKMGPIWDFDLAFGGNPFGNDAAMGGFGGFFGGAEGNDMAFYNQPEGYHIAKADWFVQMFKDPEFLSLLLKKVDAMIADSATIMAYIDASEARLALSASADTVNYYTTSGFDMNDPDAMNFSMEDLEDMGIGGFPMPGMDSAGGFGAFPFPMPGMDSAGGFGAFPFPMSGMDSAGGFGAFPFPMPGMDSAGGFGAFPFPMPGMDSAGGFGAFPFPMPGMDSAGGFGAFPFPMPGMDSTMFGGFDANFGFGGASTPHRSFAEEFEWIKEFVSKRLAWLKSDLEERLKKR
ncbi:MAG: CotH kinase family protein [Salinivirgaceae bacterium]|nr:CotH kinase family protein [Salinivirgaceae bacterium]